MLRDVLSKAFPLYTRPDAAKRILAFPFAGGGAGTYSSWASLVPQEVELAAVELPGRGGRLDETPVREWPALLELVAAELAPKLDKPFVVFGHSLGGKVAFQFVRLLRRRGLPMPLRLFISATPFPDGRPPKVHSSLPEPALKAELARMGGTPPEVLAADDLMALLLPAIRADLHLNETCVLADEPPLQTPITAFRGSRDAECPRDRVDGWLEMTHIPAESLTFDEGHFYLDRRARALLDRVLAPLGCATLEKRSDG